MIKKFLFQLAGWLASHIGNPFALLIVFGVLTITFLFGVITGYSETWFKWTEFGIYVCTFIIVFIIEISTQTDTKAIHVKLDEIIRSLPQPDNKKAGIEHVMKTGEPLDKIMENHKKVNKRNARKAKRNKVNS